MKAAEIDVSKPHTSFQAVHVNDAYEIDEQHLTDKKEKELEKKQETAQETPDEDGYTNCSDYQVLNIYDVNKYSVEMV